MDESRALSYAASSSFPYFKSLISGYERTETEASQEEQEKDQNFLFSLNQENTKRLQEWLN